MSPDALLQRAARLRRCCCRTSERDEALAPDFFRELDLLFYAAAALPQPALGAAAALARRARGEPVPFVSAWGATETSPLVTRCTSTLDGPANIGLPVPGAELKLVPERRQARDARAGPAASRPATSGTRNADPAAFDEEGFYRIGDAVRLADAARSRTAAWSSTAASPRTSSSPPAPGCTWARCGSRADRGAARRWSQDVVIAGHDREEVGVARLPEPGRRAGDVRPIRAGDAADRAGRRRARIARRSLRAYNRGAAQRAAARVRSALLLAEPPSIDAGEITDKGYINQRAVLDRRAGLVEALYAPDDPDVIRL